MINNKFERLTKVLQDSGVLADVLSISLPVKDQKPDYEIMETIISAIHKLVIKDVVLCVERKKEKT